MPQPEQHLIRTAETFPWPEPVGDEPPSSSQGVVLAMAWPGLTLAQRCVAIYVGDGALTGSAASINRLAATLEVSTDELLDLLWDLLESGFLARVAGWWHGRAGR